MLYPVKIEFKEWPSGSWEDWSQLLHDAPSVSKKVESENEGEAGLIVFDDCPLTFRNQGVVDDAFGDDNYLTSVQRYLYKISNVRKGLYAENFNIITHLGDSVITNGGDNLGANYADLQETQIYEGMADFGTLEWPEMSKLVSINALDKLSALGILQSKPARTIYSLKDSTTNHPPWLVPLDYANGSYYHIVVGVSPNVVIEVIKYEYPDFTPVHINVGSTVPVFSAGTILVREESSVTKLFFAQAQYFYEGSYPGENDTWLQPGNDSDAINGTYVIDSSDDHAYLISDSSIKLKYYKDVFYSNNICNTSYAYDTSLGLWKTSVTSFKGITCLIQLVDQAWGSIVPILKGITTFNIPYEFWRQTIDENPFNKTPLEALKMLANTMKVYVYFNKQGTLVIQKKSEDSLGTSGVTRSIGNTKIVESFKRKFFWDKLVDGVTVEVKSWLTDSYGDAITGTAEVTKQIEPGINVKPRNPLTVELLWNDYIYKTVVSTTSPTPDFVGQIGKSTSGSLYKAISLSGTMWQVITDEQEILNSVALSEATDYLNFYGMRRSSYEGTLDLDENTEGWELVDNIELEGKECFFTQVNIDPFEKTVNLEAIEVEGHDYDRRQIVITPSGN